VGLTDAALEAAAAAAAAAVAAAVSSGGRSSVRLGAWRDVGAALQEHQQHQQHREQQQQQQQGAAGLADGEVWGSSKWFVGYRVPCASAAAARRLQQLLQRACQQLDSMIACHSWQRQPLL
jgi:hypothetical protein